MDSDRSPFSLSNSQKLCDDGIRRSGAINEEQVSVVDAVASELETIVFGLIQSDDVGDAEVLKDLDVVLGAIATLGLAGLRICWPHECDELVGQDPVEVPIFDHLVVFVLLVIEVAEFVPAQPNRKLETLQAVEHGALISASVAVASVAEGPKLVVIGRKGFPDNLGSLLENHDHEGTHEVGRVAILIVLG